MEKLPSLDPKRIQILLKHKRENKIRRTNGKIETSEGFRYVTTFDGTSNGRFSPDNLPFTEWQIFAVESAALHVTNDAATRVIFLHFQHH